MNQPTRRQFNLWTASALSSALMTQAAFANRTHSNGSRTPIAIATWSFGLEPSRKAFESMLANGSAIDAVEAGIRITEADRGNRSVGIGGIPNADGVVQLDACVMDGATRHAGSVAALEDIAHPISVAKRVMEITPHVMLAGAGAKKFALEQGFQPTDLLTERERVAHQAWQKKQEEQRRAIDPVAESGSKSGSDSDEADDRKKNHDTISLLTMDASGTLAGGCSTSGWGYKLPGRVGDSPIIGSGLYVDGTAGGAGATGLGEIMMRYCASFLVVEAMRRGASPENACIEAIERIVAGEGESPDTLSANFVAINPAGDVGAAGTDRGFRYAVVTEGIAEVREPKLVR